MSKLKYLNGFGNRFQSEAIKGVLPVGQNSPQKVSRGLYAEQLSGSAFTMPRNQNQYSWLYRIRPSVVHCGDFRAVKQNLLRSSPIMDPCPPTQLRWDPLPIPKKPTDFIQGLVTMAGNGDTHTRIGGVVHLYVANQSMKNDYFYNADGEMLVVPQQGDLRFKTEFGILEVKPGEIIVIPRGIKFQVELMQKTARGYICENLGAAFRLPDLGPIGSNGLANPRDFEYPVAAFEERKGNFKLYTKFQGVLWQTEIKYSPLDVVAWHGNYVPYKYNLEYFNTINTVSFDHPDPSIFTVLTSPTDTPGLANIDFVIFPPRWMVSEHTFRPPYFHRNVMSEFMGLIQGEYDAKEEGFVPGGSSLHNCMSAHGPDVDVYEKAIKAELKPAYFNAGLAFMFESCFVWRPTKYALNSSILQKDYLQVWQPLKGSFKK